MIIEVFSLLVNCVALLVTILQYKEKRKKRKVSAPVPNEADTIL